MSVEPECFMTEDGKHTDGGIDPDWNEQICGACHEEVATPACVCDGPDERGNPGLCWGVPGETEGCDACLALNPEAHCLADREED